VITAVRRRIAEEIAALASEPLLVAQTEPPAGSALVNGPIVVEVRGAAQPGATVRVNGQPVETDSRGHFACTARPRGEANEIAIEAERDGKKKTSTRRFVVRR